MDESFQLLVRRRVSRQVLALSAARDHDPKGPAAAKLATLLGALNAVAHGRERDYAGERLGYSSHHFDLRDCAEVKVPFTQEFTRRGRLFGPSHRLIYREFVPPTAGDKPVREVICFEPRASGRAFEIAGQELRRARGTRIESLENLPNTTPAVGSNKDLDRPTSPPRLQLPPDVFAALQSSVPHDRAPSPLPSVDAVSRRPRDIGELRRLRAGGCAEQSLS